MTDAELTRTPLWPLSVAQFHAMFDQGILSPDDPVELLDGFIVQKLPKTPLHRIATRSTRQALERVVPDGCMWTRKNPLRSRRAGLSLTSP